MTNDRLKGIVNYGIPILLTGILLLFLTLCIISEHADADPGPTAPLVFHVSADDTELSILPWQSGDECCVFLPSFAAPDRMTAELPGSEPVYLNGIRLTDGMSCAAFPLNSDAELRIGNAAPLRFRMMRSENLSTIFVRTASGGMDQIYADKSRREPAALCVVSPAGTREYITTGLDWLRGHGNSTWELDKRSFNLYLGQKSSLLGMLPAENYVLVSNAIDDTCLRNRLVYDFASAVAGYDGFSPDCEFADLYLNGEYAGLYLLCEKPAFSENRLNPEPGSFLYELTAYGSEDDWQCIPQDSGMFAEIHTPEPCTGAQKEQFEKRLAELRSALLSSDSGQDASSKSWTDGIDLDSWARKYLIEEIFENADAGFFSQYFFWVPSEDRIYAGPCWDYDGAIGMFELFPNCFWAQRDHLNAALYNPTYAALWEHESFRSYVTDLYQTAFLPELNRLFDETIPYWSGKLGAALEMNRIRWYDSIEDVSDSIREMTAYLRQHVAFLNSAWVDGVSCCTITLKGTPGGSFLYFCVPEGSPCSSLPPPTALGAESEVWFLEDSGLPFDPDTVVTDSLILTAYHPAVSD